MSRRTPGIDLDSFQAWLYKTESRVTCEPSPRRMYSPAQDDQPTLAKKSLAHRVEASEGFNEHEKLLVRELEAAGIVNVTEVAHFLAQTSHETQGFNKLKENMNYSAERLLTVFPRYFRTDDDAAELAHKREEIAERVYGGRMGNDKKGDGFLYIGRGYIHLTGKNNYAAAGRGVGLDLVGKPQLVEDRGVAARTAVWFWKHNNIGPIARGNNIRGVTKKVNGGGKGLAERTRLTERYVERLSRLFPSG